MYNIRHYETDTNTEINRAENYKTYDIYLSMGCQTLPDFGDLVQEAPVLADPALHARMLQDKPRPGFLGLDLSRSTATKVLQALKAAKACGYRINSVYRRKPTITIEQAAPIAERAFAELKATRSNVIFDPLEFRGEDPVCWVFGAASPQWIEEGRIPGVLHVSVDKLDGHVWQPEEFDRLHDEEYLTLPSGRTCSTQDFMKLPREERLAIIAEVVRRDAEERRTNEELNSF